jgi:hypothetical protein
MATSPPATVRGQPDVFGWSREIGGQQGAVVLIMHRLHESLPSGVTWGTIWSVMCWRRRPAGDRRGVRDVRRRQPVWAALL